MNLTVCLLGHGPLSDGGACLSCGATMVSPVSWRHEAVPARLDPVATAAPLTRLLSRVDVEKAGSHCVTAGPATVIEDTRTGERVALHEPEPCPQCGMGHDCADCQRAKLSAAEDAVAHLEAKRVELQERVDIAEAKADALEGELRFAHSRIRAVAHSACTRHMLEWSPEDIRKGLSCTKADRCSACRCADFLDGKPDTDLDTALALLRSVATYSDRDDDVVCASCHAEPDQHDPGCALAAFLAAHPVSP